MSQKSGRTKESTGKVVRDTLTQQRQGPHAVGLNLGEDAL